MNRLRDALALISDRQGWARVDEVRRACGAMAVDGVLSKGYAVVDLGDDTLQLTEAGVRALKDLRA